MNNIINVRMGATCKIENDSLVYLDLNMTLTKQEFSRMEATIKFLGMKNTKSFE